MFTRSAALTALLIATLAGRGLGADAPTVKELHTQRVGDTTYFRVSITTPHNALLYGASEQDLARDDLLPRARFALARLPRLVSLDGHAVHVCLWTARPSIVGRRDELVFHGQVVKPGASDLRLIYPTREEPEARADSLAPVDYSVPWAAERLELVFKETEATPQRARNRRALPAADDLEGRWAEAQARQFAILEVLSDGFGYYSLARESLGRRYHVPAAPLPRPANGSPDRDETMRLYEMTTGATALAETLATHRLLNSSTSKQGRRVNPVADIRGIDVAEHPWEKMMEGKKPADEPLAKLIPFDHYYVHFHSIKTFIEFGELSDRWGGSIVQAYEMQSRDYDLKHRYEKQLCLRSTVLSKTLGPALIRGLAITGSDLCLREGSDVTVIFDVRDRGLFLASVEPFIAEARKEFGKELKEDKDRYQGVTIETFTTPRREVCLHRAIVGDFVICANSPVALRRILDTQAGRRKGLAEMQDFRYMRTVFRADDKAEDGFIFLSDAFIRQLVGPTAKIKEKRRLEALASLSLVTHGALVHAVEAGKLPVDLLSLLSSTGLSADEVAMPEGEGLRWDGERRVAVSDAYNTIHFLTPLIELPIDKVTDEEQREYERFRQNYLLNWRRYFDPVGMRLGLKPDEVKLEVYLLPLVANSDYNALRDQVGGGTAAFDPKLLSPRTLAQYFTHINPRQRTVEGKEKALGSWLFVRWDDGPAYQKLARSWIEYELNPPNWLEQLLQQVQLLGQTPLTVGVEMGDEAAFDAALASLRDSADRLLGKTTTDELKDAPPGITIRRLQFPRDGMLGNLMREGRYAIKDPSYRPALYHAKAGGAWFISTSEASLRGTIELVLARRDAKDRREELPQVNGSLYVAPRAANAAAGAVKGYLEWQAHGRALASLSLWQPLYQAGLLAEDAKPAVAATAARKYLGFVPSSPDGSACRFDRAWGEVVNDRHGSPGRPKLHGTIAPDAPLARLLDDVPWLRADLRFRADGIHTTITLKREPARK